MKAVLSKVIVFVSCIAVFASCSSYKLNIMFKVPEGTEMKKMVAQAEQNYVIQKNDYLKLEVYTSGGERIIDPDLLLTKDMPTQSSETKPEPNYLVDVNGVVKFPMVGELKLDGLTIRKAEEVLQQEYSKFYKEPFVILQYTNKRVIVLGAPGGKLIPLVNENVTLVEILAMANGIDNNSMAQNIRVIRGDEVFVADLSTIEGYRAYNMIMHHGDIVYVEPIRRPVSEAGRDYAPILSLAISITTLIVVLIGL